MRVHPEILANEGFPDDLSRLSRICRTQFHTVKAGGQMELSCDEAQRGLDS